MPTKTYALVEGAPNDLSVEWGLFFRRLEARYRGSPVLRFDSKSALETGATVGLPDGSTLAIRLCRSALATDLEILRDGVPIPGSPTHPTTLVRGGAAVFAVIAVLTVLVSLAAIAGGAGAAAVGGLVEGALFGAAAIGTYRLSKAALYAGTAFFVLDTVFVVVDTLGRGAAYAAGGLAGMLVMRTIFFLLILRAIRAIGRVGGIDARSQAKVFE